MSRIKDRTNNKYYKLTFIEKTNKRKHGYLVWLCRCDCGNFVESYHKEKKSCGCLYRESIIARCEKIQINLDFNKENMYFWGFLWGDGYFLNNTIRLEITSDDMEDITNIIPNTFKFYHRKRNNRRPQSTAYISSKNYTGFLMDNGYIDRQIPSTKILDHDLAYMWYRGLIDADGCWYRGNGKNNNTRQFCISSNYNQNWGYIIKLFEKIKVIYSIQRMVTNKNHQYSCIRTTNKQSLNNIRSYLYQDYDEIGLKRKFKKSIETCL